MLWYTKRKPLFIKRVVSHDIEKSMSTKRDVLVGIIISPSAHWYSLAFKQRILLCLFAMQGKSLPFSRKIADRLIISDHPKLFQMQFSMLKVAYSLISTRFIQLHHDDILIFTSVSEIKSGIRKNQTQFLEILIFGLTILEAPYHPKSLIITRTTFLPCPSH